MLVTLSWWQSLDVSDRNSILVTSFICRCPTHMFKKLFFYFLFSHIQAKFSRCQVHFCLQKILDPKYARFYINIQSYFRHSVVWFTVVPNWYFGICEKMDQSSLATRQLLPAMPYYFQICQPMSTNFNYKYVCYITYFKINRKWNWKNVQ